MPRRFVSPDRGEPSPHITLAPCYFEWTTVTAWRKKILKKIKAESGAEGSDSDVYVGCQILVSLRKARHHKPLPEPITLAREVLEDGLVYSTPVRLWGIDEATREFY